MQELGRTGGMSLEQLVEITGYGDRTLRRDLHALRDAGYVVTAEQPDKRKLWKLDNRAQSKRLTRVFDYAHFLALTVAMRQGGPARSNPMIFAALEDLSDKLETALGAQVRDRLAAIDACFYSYEKQAYAETPADVLWPIVNAIQQRRMCSVTYRTPQPASKNKQFEILPLRIFAHDGAAYLMAHALKHDSTITLNLQRLKKLKVLDRVMEIPADFDPQRIERAAFGVHTGGEPTKYVLDFDSDVAAYIRERTWHSTQALSDLPTGGVRLELTCGTSYEVSAWVASWRHWVHVVEPESLREELLELGHNLVAKYSSRPAKSAKRKLV
jgi:predicted DNA-binding transcriptional regulator YafY